MLPHPGCVEDDITLRLLVPGDDGLLLTAGLRYDPSDPYAVEATFRAGEESISWVLGRDLLRHGLLAPSGEGDVRVWPATEDGAVVVMVRLSSPDGEAVLAIPAAGLQDFLLRTTAVVPVGMECRHLDVDDAIARLLAS